ncbi:DUF4347 domain-containing protein [Undibacterium seohonense]|uniref:DUF4347 domain-containing protein n=1 Tax=Undibacterium seohonense TaxID=1344950 RepID=A0ABR6X2T9_9BURK|nr:Ig-like domain-containing protein [Undibacterium seohonense]MBC3807165.1 DUF4347 domain-containing protein [Undibacterium seohonense]
MNTTTTQQNHRALDTSIDSDASSAPLSSSAVSVSATQTAPKPTTTVAHEIVFVDTTLPNWQSLIKDIKPGTEIITLDPLKNGVQQIADALQGKAGITAVHIMSHGGEGYLVMGNTMVSSHNLVDYQSSFAKIRAALSSDADILLYGCDVAKGEVGAHFVSQLAQITGADIAASTNDTGVSGDWVLEYQSGAVETNVVAASEYGFDLATIKVTNLNDSGAGSLRAAITSATGNAAADTIVFDPALFASGAATLTLTSGALNVHGDGDLDAFTIIGPGENLLTISGNNASRVFMADNQIVPAVGTAGQPGYVPPVYAANTSSLSLSGMTLTNATSAGARDSAGGGAILSYYSGNLTLDHVVVKNSTAGGGGGGLKFGGDNGNLVINTSTFDSNSISAGGANGTGGGIAAFAQSHSITISNSTISNNTNTTGFYGGGAFLGGVGSTVTVTNTTIAGNSAGSGNIQAGGGGGIIIQSPSVVITNSTIVNNAWNGGNAPNNGGGGLSLFNGGAAILRNNIIANNTSTNTVMTDTDVIVTHSGSMSGTGNLIPTAVGLNYTATNTTTSTQTSLGSALGPLAFNGGPVKTIAVAAGSNAIGNGTITGAPTTDARGVGRGGTVDIGAYEFSDDNTFDFTGVVSPNRGAIDVPSNYNLSIEFGTAVTAVAAKNIVIYRQSDNAVLETIAATDTGKVTFSSGTGGTNSQVTINPTATLVSNTGYYVLIDSGAFQDGSSNTYDGISSNSTWTFTSAAVPTSITSATYDANTGVLVVTGTDITNGGTIDVTKLSLTGQGGSYTLTAATSNPTASSATSFTVTLGAADKIAVNGVLNNNGTTSVTGGVTFNLAAAANWDVTAAASADLTGNGVTVSNVAAPTLESATYDANTGTLIVTGTNLVKAIGSNNDITASKISIRGEGNVTYVLTDTADVDITSATSFTLILSAADKAGLNQYINKDGTLPTSASSLYLVKGADDWNTVITGGDTKDIVNNFITVSNVAVPTITSATYNASTGNLVVTGTGFTHLNNGGTDDIIANKFTITGEGGSTYTLTNTANVEITSGTAFTLVLSATDKSALNQIVNKSGSSSTGGSTYNLAAAEDWAAGADAAVVVADTIGDGITATVTPPAITSATYDAGTGTLVVTGSGFTHRAGATNDIIANTFTLTGQGGSTYSLTDTANVEINSDSSFTLVLSSTDKAGLRTLLNNNGSQSSGGTTYNLAAADNWANGADSTLNIADASGNTITVSNVVSPTITSASYDASTGILSVTGANMVNGDSIDVSKLSVTGEGGAYTLTSAGVNASSATAFSVTLNATDKLAINGILNNDGTSSVNAATFNLAAAAGWNTTVNTTADLTGNGITVSNVTAPTITSATYDGTSRVFVITGENLVKTIGANNDITISALTITGEGGATRTLSTTGNVEVTSATSFTFTIAGADIVAVNSLLNKNGTSSASSSTNYNLAVADNWNSVVTGGNIQDLTGNGITVANAAPSILSSTYDAATGILSVSAVNIVSGDTIDVSKLSITGQAGSYTLTTAPVTASSSTAFSVTLNAADKLAINGILNNNGTSAVSTTTYNLSAATNWNQTTASGADTTGNAITVSNVTAPTITSATYNGTSHVFVVTGTNLVKTIGATNDVTISALTITGEGGATHTLSTTGNVEVTSDNSFTFTLAGADIAAVDSLLNKNGTSSASSSTTYNLAVADDWNSVVTGGNIQDLTGNGITVTNAAPSIISSTYNAATGVLTVSAVNIVAADNIDVSKLSITGEGGSYTLTTAGVTATSATEFSVTLNAADKLAINGILNNNGTSAVSAATFNLSAAANWDSSRASGADTTDNAITVSNVTAPSITSATYDFTTHVLTVTGTGLVGTLGATNDITVDALTITGEGGATRALMTTGNVEVLSDTSFAITLAGADQAAVEALFTKNGLTSTNGTSYNLAAADDWNSVITGGNIADATSPITVANVPVPTITSSVYNASTGALVVTGTGFRGAFGANNDIVANKFSLQGEGGASYTLTNTSNVEINSTTSFTLTLSAADRLGANLIMNKNGTSSTSVNTYNLVANEDWNTGADAAVVIADLTGNGVTVSNVVAPTVSSATYNVATGVLVVTGNNFLSLTGANNDITANRIRFLGQDAINYTLTNTPNIDITSNTSFTMTMSVADKAQLALRFNKNGTSSTDLTTYNIGMLEDWNTGAATAVVIADLFGNFITVSGVNPTTSITASSFSADAGTSSSDFITNTAAQTISGTLSANLLLGESVEVSTNNGGSWTTASATVGQSTWSLAGATLSNGTSNFKVRVVDSYANSGPEYSQSYTLETVRPTVVTNMSFTDNVLAIGDTATMSLSFSEAVSDLTIADFTVPNGVLSNLTSSDGGITWTATLTPNAGVNDATNTITLDNTAYIDVAGNTGTGTTISANYAIDTLRPTATITMSDIDLGVPDTALVTFTFSEPVTGFTNDDLTLPVTAPMGTLSPVSSSDGGLTWTATYTPPFGLLDTSNLITLNTAGVIDGLGNPGLGLINSPNFTINTVNIAPSLGGITPGLSTTDSMRIVPFASVTVTDPDIGALETATIGIDNPVKGSFTSNSLALSGFYTNDGGITYVHDAASPTVMQAAIRALVFEPNPSRLSIGTSDVTTFTIVVRDQYLDSVSNSSTTLTISNVNSAPTDILLSDAIVSQSEGANAIVGTLSAVDKNIGDTHTFSLAASNAFNDNTKFTLVGNSLKVINPASMTEKDYFVAVQVTDANGLSFTKKLTVSLDDDIAPYITSIETLRSPRPTITTGSYIVKFNESVTGVSIDDFFLTSSAGTTAHLSSVTALTGNAYRVYFDQIVGTGVLNLNLKTSGTGISDLFGNSLPSAVPLAPISAISLADTQTAELIPHVSVVGVQQGQDFIVM